MGIEVIAGVGPVVMGEDKPNPHSLHDWLALPVQHFIDKHPEKSREELIHEACEVVAELVASCGTSWISLRAYRQHAADCLAVEMRAKFDAHDRVRRGRN